MTRFALVLLALFATACCSPALTREQCLAAWDAGLSGPRPFPVQGGWLWTNRDGSRTYVPSSQPSIRYGTGGKHHE